MPGNKRKIGVILLVCIFVIVIDQFSKILFSIILPLNKSIPVIGNFFHLTLIHNTGIAFGILKDSSRVILIVTIVGLALISYSLKKDLLNYRYSIGEKAFLIRRIAIGFIIGGAIGNMIDRIHLGYVIDFLDFRVWPVFNFADSFITIGAVLLFFNLFIPSNLKKV